VVLGAHPPVRRERYLSDFSFNLFKPYNNYINYNNNQLNYTNHTPCAFDVCFSVKFNSQPVVYGNVVWLSAVFQPKFQGGSAIVSFTDSYITINGGVVSPTPPDSFINLNSALQSCGTGRHCPVSGEAR
jgi:hypothetical protein